MVVENNIYFIPLLTIHNGTFRSAKDKSLIWPYVVKIAEPERSREVFSLQTLSASFSFLKEKDLNDVDFTTNIIYNRICARV